MSTKNYNQKCTYVAYCPPLLNQPRGNTIYMLKCEIEAETIHVEELIESHWSTIRARTGIPNALKANKDAYKAVIEMSQWLAKDITPSLNATVCNHLSRPRGQSQTHQAPPSSEIRTSQDDEEGSIEDHHDLPPPTSGTESIHGEDSDGDSSSSSTYDCSCSRSCLLNCLTNIREAIINCFSRRRDDDEDTSDDN